MKKLLTIVGARPQFIKAAALNRAIKNRFADELQEIIVHTGQHYDHNMSKVFFEEMNIPQPNYNLHIGSSSHGVQTAAMIEKLEGLIHKEKPDFVVLYGDTNSTLAGSIAASKIHVPIVHIEAGLRSFNKKMPEEINRIVCDHTSTLLFSPTKTAINNLINEGFNAHARAPYSADNPGIFHCGDIMYDNSLFFAEMAKTKSTVLTKYGLEKDNYILGTVHREHNTDSPERLNTLFFAINQISSEFNIDVVLPLHPRTSKILETNLKQNTFRDISTNPRIKIIPPVSFFDIITLEKNCKLVMTDSGGVQKEAYFFKKPVIILREETEWVEIVENGTGKVTDVNAQRILEAYSSLSSSEGLEYPPVFGDGQASEFICSKISEC